MYKVVRTNAPVLSHSGILGMKWGVRRYQYEDGSLTPEGKLRYAERSVGMDRDSYYSQGNTDVMKEHIKKSKAEADDRIRFYGGRNVAKNAIQEEKRYHIDKTNEEADALIQKVRKKTIGAAIATASVLIGATFIGSLLFGFSAVEAAILSLGAVAVSAAIDYAIVSYGRHKQAEIDAWRKETNKFLEIHANEQIAFTDDSDYGADIVVKKSKDY